MNISRFSIDVDLKRKAISGWFAGSDEETIIKIYHRGRLLAQCGCLIIRQDVKAAGIHPTGMCGFSFLAEETGLIYGCIYKIVIVSGIIRKETSRLYGDKIALLTEFVRHDLTPRSDYKYLAPTTDEVYSDNSDILAYKNIMIRLRRGKRNISSHGKFIGLDYPFVTSDFSLFRSLTEDFLDVWLDFLNPRYLWSVVDTYADYGLLEERLGALAVSNYMHAERLFQTRNCVFDMCLKQETNRSLKQAISYWGGMGSNQLEETAEIKDDALDVFLTRNIEILESVPIIRSFFFELLKRSSLEIDSGLGFNLSYSKYFSNIFSKYVTDFFR